MADNTGFVPIPGGPYRIMEDRLGFHHAADDFSRSDQMLLTDETWSGFRAHAKREIVSGIAVLSSVFE